MARKTPTDATEAHCNKEIRPWACGSGRKRERSVPLLALRLWGCETLRVHFDWSKADPNSEWNVLTSDLLALVRHTQHQEHFFLHELMKKMTFFQRKRTSIAELAESIGRTEEDIEMGLRFLARIGFISTEKLAYTLRRKGSGVAETNSAETQDNV